MDTSYRFRRRGGQLHYFQIGSGQDRGAVWMGGSSPVVDRHGNVYVASADGYDLGTGQPYDDSDAAAAMRTISRRRLWAMACYSFPVPTRSSPSWVRPGCRHRLPLTSDNGSAGSARIGRRLCTMTGGQQNNSTGAPPDLSLGARTVTTPITTTHQTRSDGTARPGRAALRRIPFVLVGGDRVSRGFFSGPTQPWPVQTRPRHR
jgi:hypothetical protein